MGGETYKSRLALSVVVLIAAWNNFVAVLKRVIAKVTHLETFFKCVCVP